MNIKSNLIWNYKEFILKPNDQFPSVYDHSYSTETRVSNIPKDSHLHSNSFITTLQCNITVNRACKLSFNIMVDDYEILTS